VQTDLLGLEISKGEVRRLTGFDPDDIFRPSILKDSQKRGAFFLNELFVALALTPIIVGVIYFFIIRLTIGASTLVAILLLITVPITVIFGRSLWRRKTCPKALTILLDEIDKYHSVIKAIDINDQLVDSGNTKSRLNDRDKVVEALQMIREDLVRALKTERILRDNKKLLVNNPELFVSNLANVQALQVSQEASEYAQLLNESLQIALDVQAEIGRLQSP
jgi:hypothetical protein